MILGLMGALFANLAHADGFVCMGSETGKKFQIYNHVHPSEGTRKAAVMILSNPAASRGQQTVAIFSDSEKTLKSYGTIYSAVIDLNASGISRPSELIAGTTLDQLKKIEVVVYFNYRTDAPTAFFGDTFEGKISYLKLNGEEPEEPTVCTRYLKH